MREKIIVTIACFICIGLYLNSKKSNIDESSMYNNLNMQTTSKDNTFIEPENEDSTIGIIDDPNKNLNSNEFEINNSLSKMNSCSLDNKETNMMSFKEAFGYYRNCLGTDNQFNWKGTDYTTLLSNELENQIADSTRAENSILNEF